MRRNNPPSRCDSWVVALLSAPEGDTNVACEGPQANDEGSSRTPTAPELVPSDSQNANQNCSQ